MTVETVTGATSWAALRYSSVTVTVDGRRIEGRHEERVELEQIDSAKLPAGSP